MTVDNGAYHSIGNVIINRALHMLTSSYYIPNIKVTSRLVYTNNPWGSAARGAGPPQAHYRPGVRRGYAGRKAEDGPAGIQKT